MDVLAFADQFVHDLRRYISEWDGMLDDNGNEDATFGGTLQQQLNRVEYLISDFMLPNRRQ